MIRMTYGALCALLIIAVSCGGDAGGGPNGPTGDGGKLPPGNGDGDGAIPEPDAPPPTSSNPLVTAIPGLWEITVVDGQPSTCACAEGVTPSTPSWECRCAGYAMVDPMDPDCSQALQSQGQDLSMGPPGDACITKLILDQDPALLILDGDTVRTDPSPGCTLGCNCRTHICFHVQGRVADGGTRIAYTVERVDISTTTEQALQKVR